MTSSSKVALIGGASGLVGRHLLQRACAAGTYHQVIVVTRRDLGSQVGHPAAVQVVVDFAALDRERDRLVADHVFCALGTTMRKAGTRARFRAVDFAYPLALAQLTRAAGAAHFSLVSALSANPRSRVFYSRVKGELEAAVRAVNFPSLTIVRPSVIAGPRDEFRLGETVGRWALALAPRAWRAVHADTIAAAMIARAAVERPGTEILESKALHAFREPALTGAQNRR